MIRIFRKFSYTKVLRNTQYSSIRLCSSKSDDSPFRAAEYFKEELNTESSPRSFPKGNNIDNNYSQQKNATLIGLIDKLPTDPKNISPGALLDFYEKIKGNFLIPYHVTTHPNFKVLREATEIYLPKFSTKEMNNIFIAILPSKSVMHDKLGKIVVDALLTRVSYMPFNQIIFMDFLILKYYKVTELSPNYNILRLTLQTIFLSKVENELEALDGSDSFKDIMKIVAYCQNNSEIISEKIVNNLTTSLLLTDDEMFTANDIVTILLFLANLGELNDHVEKILRKMITLWYQLPVTANKVQILMKILAAKNSTHKIDKGFLMNSEFIRHCVNIVIQQNDIKLSFSVQNSCNRMGLVSVELIENLSKFFEKSENIQKLAVRDYIILCTACVKAEYKPTNWESHILEALGTFKFSNFLTAVQNFDWAQFALNLDKLGYCDTRLIQNILSSKYLQKQENYEQSKLDKLQEILDREGSSSSDDSDSENTSSSDEDTNDDKLPLYGDLKNMFDTKIWANVRIDRKLTIPYVLKMDLQSGDFMSVPEMPSIQHSNDNELLIGILVVGYGHGEQHSRNKFKYAKEQCHRIERNGWSSIILDESKWNTLKNYEKSLIFYTKIVKMMEAYRKKRLRKLGKEY